MPKTVNEGFNTFLGWLEPLGSEHQKAQSHKSSVETCLINNYGCTRFFETGSFGNGTGVRHYSDTDYFAVMPSNNLWDNSEYTLRKIKESLQGTFTRTAGIGVNCPAVAIPFGTYASETMEITPCCFGGFVDTPLGKYAKYSIPDCNKDWMYSSPDAHNAYVNSENTRLKKNKEDKEDKVKNLIRLVKAWKYYNNVPIISFYLELRVTKYVESESSIIYDIDLCRFLKKLQSIELAKMKDPMGISGLIPASKTEAQKQTALSKLNSAVSRAEKAIEAKDKGNIDDAFTWWNLLFNSEFPAR